MLVQTLHKNVLTRVNLLVNVPFTISFDGVKISTAYKNFQRRKLSCLM